MICCIRAVVCVTVVVCKLRAIIVLCVTRVIGIVVYYTAATSDIVKIRDLFCFGRSIVISEIRFALFLASLAAFLASLV